MVTAPNFTSNGDITISEPTPKLRLTDTDTGADSDISGSSSNGSLFLSADTNNEVANTVLAFQVDGATKAYIGTDGLYTQSGANSSKILDNSTRNLTNIGTISSGTITSSGKLQLNDGADIQWAGGYGSNKPLIAANGNVLKFYTHGASGGVEFQLTGSAVDFRSNPAINVGTISSGAITASGVDNLLYLQSGATGTPTLRFEQGTTRRAFLRYQNANSNFDIINEYGGVAIWTGTSGSESQKVLVDSSGNVGIGQSTIIGSSSGRVALTMGGSTSSIITFGNNGTRWGGIYASATDYSIFSDSLMRFEAGGSERMRIDSSGRLLIAATSTSFNDKLYVLGDGYTTGGWRVGTTSTFVGKMYNNAGKLSIESDGTRDIKFGNSTNTEVMYIDTSEQKVGIGTTSPAQKLDVAGKIKSTGSHLVATTSGVGVGGTPADENSGELGAGFLNLARDDTAQAKQIQFAKNGAVHSYIATQSADILYDTTSGRHTFALSGSSAFNISTTGTNAFGTLSGQALKASVYGISIGSTQVISSARVLENITTAKINGASSVIRLTDSNITDANHNTLVAYASAQNKFALGVSSTTGTSADIVIDGANDRVGIGKTPSVKLDVNGQMRGTGQFELEVDGNDKARFTDDQSNYIEMDGGAFEMDFALDGTVQARMFDNGDFHIDGTLTQNSTQVPSDIRLKKNITPIDNALSLVDSLKGVHFDWRKDDKKAIGFIAQEVEEVLPELVSEVSELHNREEKHKTVDYQSVIPVLVEAIKEQQRQIEALQAQINNI